MARRLILDTGVIIKAERGTVDLSSVIGDDDDVVIAAITVAELSGGSELADEGHRPARSQFVSFILESIPIELYDMSVAQAHGRLIAHVHRTGSRRGAHDLIVAATAAATRRTVVTTDRQARLGDLPGVDCHVLQ